MTYAEILNIVFFRQRCFDEMFVCHAPEIVCRGDSITMFFDKIFHHRKKRRAVAITWFGKGKMDHSKNESAFILNQSLIRPGGFAGVKPMSQNNRTDIGKFSFTDSDQRSWRKFERIAHYDNQLPGGFRVFAQSGVKHAGIFGKTFA